MSGNLIRNPRERTITRARRKIQSKYPELTNKKIASFRDKKQKEFIAYSRKV